MNEFTSFWVCLTVVLLAVTAAISIADDREQRMVIECIKRHAPAECERLVSRAR
jgi:hypothetical protein